jgi:hypothetical protein
MADRSTPPGGELPSLHIARAALHVAAIVDQRGSVVADAQESYWHHATGGTFAPADLDRGERLMLDIGLLAERDGRLTPTCQLAQMIEEPAAEALAILAQRILTATGAVEAQTPHVAAQLAELVPDSARREQLLLALARQLDCTRQVLIGEIGEELVMMALRQQLTSIGRRDLAEQVRRVSLISDQLGYDISAPRVVGAPRLLEVKATTVDTDPHSLAIHLTRNEADTGMSFPNWALVATVVDSIDDRHGVIVGWCTAELLADLLPVDARACRWEQALIELPLDRLSPGLPGVVG